MKIKTTRRNRAALRSLLGRIIELFSKISTTMEEIPHKRGVVTRSLKHKGNPHEYITNSTNVGGSITVEYLHSDGHLYEIRISKSKKQYPRPPAKATDDPIDMDLFSIQLGNILGSMNISTWEQLVATPQNELSKKRGFGKVYLRELVRVLSEQKIQHNFKLPT